MTNHNLKHLDRFVDRNGKARYYFRRGKGARIRLPGSPGSLEFEQAYQLALKNSEAQFRGSRKFQAASIHLVHEYFVSPDYQRLTPQTQRRLPQCHPSLPERRERRSPSRREMTRQHVQAIVGRRASTPGAANDLLKKLRILMHFAIDNGWRKDDPTIRIKKYPAGEFHTWNDNEIAHFENAWAVGTRERTAFALLLLLANARLTSPR